MSVSVETLDIPSVFGIERYVGEVVNQLPHGKGKLFYPSGVQHYDGSFHNGKFHGWGHTFYDRISTDVLRPLRQYSGKFWFGERQDGMLYLCDRFFDESRNTFFHTAANHRCVWRGKFEQNHAHGFGREFDSQGNLVYEGRVSMGLYHGKGKFYQNGSLIYHGSWRNHKRHGQGSEYMNGVETYKGKWKNDQKDLTEQIFHQKLGLFFETDDASHISKVPLAFFRKYLYENFKEQHKEWKRQQIIDRIQEKRRQVKQQTEEPTLEDLFGNEIDIACFGDDGGVYDLRSMQYMFARNDDGDYENIPYEYDEEDRRVPIYRRMHSAKQLTNYSCPALNEWNVN